MHTINTIDVAHPTEILQDTELDYQSRCICVAVYYDYIRTGRYPFSKINIDGLVSKGFGNEKEVYRCCEQLCKTFEEYFEYRNGYFFVNNNTASEYSFKLK